MVNLLLNAHVVRQQATGVQKNTAHFERYLSGISRRSIYIMNTMSTSNGEQFSYF